jgi:adenosylcobinamide kinase / adenosylcobinamide-phosphate guanylyltransferase
MRNRISSSSARAVATKMRFWQERSAKDCADDEEMRLRIERHRADRGPGWSTIEAFAGLAAVVSRESRPDVALLIDCVTLWLSNLTAAASDLDANIEALARSLPGAAGPVVLVSNEIGMGLVPETRLGREFRDWQGRANQRIASASDLVVFVAAGCALQLKPVPSAVYLLA